MLRCGWCGHPLDILTEDLYTINTSYKFKRYDMVILTDSEQEAIDFKISNIISKTGKQPPKDTILDVVNSLGIGVFIIDFDKKFPESQNNLSGMIVYSEGNEKTKIFLSHKDSPERRNFTLAHELGHRILHEANVQGRFRLDFQNFTDDVQSKEETEANYFAASLLVPKEKLLSLINVFDGYRNITHLADYFGVSESVITIRLRWLNQTI